MDYQYNYISTATTTTVSSKDIGVLHSIVIGETTAGAITISDNSGTIAVLKASIAEGDYIFDVAYVGFLQVVTAGTSKVTICYN